MALAPGAGEVEPEAGLDSLGAIRAVAEAAGEGECAGVSLAVGFGVRSGFSSGSGVFFGVVFFFFVGGCLAGFGL